MEESDFAWVIHDEGWLYQAASDKKTLRVMQEGKAVMVGEKSSAHTNTS